MKFLFVFVCVLSGRAGGSNPYLSHCIQFMCTIIRAQMGKLMVCAA